MNEAPRASPGARWLPWIGLSVGWLVQLGLKTVLPALVLIGYRVWVLGLRPDAPAAVLLPSGGAPLWYGMQAAVFLGALAGGAVAAALARTRLPLVAALLVVLSLLRTAFEQFPQPLTPLIALVWAGAPVAGVLAGVWLGRRLPFRLSLRSDG